MWQSQVTDPRPLRSTCFYSKVREQLVRVEDTFSGARAVSVELGLTYSNITKVKDTIAFVGCKHNGRSHCWTPKFQI